MTCTQAFQMMLRPEYNIGMLLFEKNTVRHYYNHSSITEQRYYIIHIIQIDRLYNINLY